MFSTMVMDGCPYILMDDFNNDDVSMAIVIALSKNYCLKKVEKV